MAIYDIFDKATDVKAEEIQPDLLNQESVRESRVETTVPRLKANQIFSSIAARLFFLILLIADFFWAIYAISGFVVTTCMTLLTGGKIELIHRRRSQFWLSVKRSLVCAISLFVALFAPSFGILIACTYFLMYDKTGIEEVVPSSLQDQFKEFMPQDNQ